MARIAALSSITEVEGQLTRRYLSRAHLQAIAEVGTWMRDAGLTTRTDALLSLYGRYEGSAPGRPAIMIGSHLDTVVDAGRFDGQLGVVAALAVVEALQASGERLHHAIEVVGFGEEEGSRFPAHILTSSALIGAVKKPLLDRTDVDGISIRQALTEAGGNADDYRSCIRRKGEVAAYLELHIEQGPVLESKGLALGTVTAINGSVRSVVSITGFAGHAGTVPMGARRDALTAASEMILAIEEIATRHEQVVATVGRMQVLPGAQNVIPGAVTFIIDLRSPFDTTRDRAHAAVVSAIRKIAHRRKVAAAVEIFQENPAVALHDDVIAASSDAITACGQKPLRLNSGAGHDAGIMAKHCPSGMIFVRCKDGVSHNPAESITVEDADIAVRAMIEAVRRLDRRLTTAV